MSQDARHHGSDPLISSQPSSPEHVPGHVSPKDRDRLDETYSVDDNRPEQYAKPEAPPRTAHSPSGSFDFTVRSIGS
ncbi:hypothetical protein B0A48_16407 [Cryoendolithus antarcticus]|uniref:Uncharacterized protein n=1 Tax=Cryoendolithus antarcticus TaxID=1507870 RepID=A0A1V8SE29_9PEZI|nr:hypothetical protein B0A48_16407 [Cryoendolithus antarcticus]